MTSSGPTRANVQDGTYAWQEPGIDLDPDRHPELYDGVIWQRVQAIAIDFVIVVLMTIAIAPVFFVLGILTLGLLWGLFAIATPLIWLAYFAFTAGGPRSATIGMRAAGIELRTWRGTRPGPLQAALQTLVFYFSLSATIFVLLVPLFNRRRRCIHDFLIGTVVINAPRAQA